MTFTSISEILSRRCCSFFFFKFLCITAINDHITNPVLTVFCWFVYVHYIHCHSVLCLIENTNDSIYPYTTHFLFCSLRECSMQFRMLSKWLAYFQWNEIEWIEFSLCATNKTQQRSVTNSNYYQRKNKSINIDVILVENVCAHIKRAQTTDLNMLFTPWRLYTRCDAIQ